MLALAYDGALRPGKSSAPCEVTSRSGPPHPAGARGDDEEPPRAGGAVLGDPRARCCRSTCSTGRVSREGALVPSESRRNRAGPVTIWTWSKVARRIALAANLPRFSTHTPRHLCLTDLARMGGELHAIATFAGHRSIETTLQYIHLSGRDLSAKLNSSMAHIHAWRIGMLTGPGVGQDAPA